MKKPHKKAVCLADIKIGDRLVTFDVVDGVVQLELDNDILTTTRRVDSSDFASRTLMLVDDFDGSTAIVTLADYGIPIIESGDQWSQERCTLKFKHALKLVHKHINDNRVMPNRGPGRQPIDWTLPSVSRQLIGQDYNS